MMLQGGQCAGAEHPQRLHPADARRDGQQQQQQQQVQQQHRLSEPLSFEPCSWESSPGSDSSRAPPESSRHAIHKWVPLGPQPGDNDSGSPDDPDLRVLSAPAFMTGAITMRHSYDVGSSFPNLDASRKRPFMAASFGVPAPLRDIGSHAQGSGAFHATHTIRKDTLEAAASAHPLDSGTKPGRRQSPSRPYMLPVSNSWHPGATWNLPLAEEHPGCMLTAAEALHLSAAVGSDQDSAGQDRDDADKANCSAPHAQHKAPAAARPQHRASCGSAASDRRAAVSIKPEEGLHGIELLPIDMREELAALERALALPSSVEELQEGLSISEIDNDLIKCVSKRGKGGRNPASDARLDPNIDPKKAMRIMANRMSAARSKLRQKLAHEGQRVKLDMLALQKSRLSQEIEDLERLCMDLEESQVGVVAANPSPPAQVPWPSHHILNMDDRASGKQKQTSPLSSNSNAAQPARMAAGAQGLAAALHHLDTPGPSTYLTDMHPSDVQLQQHQHQQASPAHLGACSGL